MQTGILDYPTDELLWKAVREKREKAFSQLFYQYSDTMLAYGMKFSNDRSLVRECIQSVFVHLFINSSRLGDVHNIKSYLLVSVKHELYAQYEKRSFRLLSLDELPSFQLETSMLVQRHEGMDDEAYNKYSQLRKAIESLSTRQKEVVYLHYMQEIPLKDVADMMNMEYQSVRNLLSRSISKMRSSFPEFKDNFTIISLLLLLK